LFKIFSGKLNSLPALQYSANFFFRREVPIIICSLTCLKHKNYLPLQSEDFGIVKGTEPLLSGLELLALVV